MAKEEKNERVASRVMELKELVAAPLVATIEADALSAGRYMDYLMRMTFEGYDANTGKGTALRMLSFEHRLGGVGGNGVRTVSIPMVTMMPLPLLQVQEADFDFDIHVVEASSEKKRRYFSLEKGTVKGGETENADVSLKVALTTPLTAGDGVSVKKSVGGIGANMKVHVKMRQADMPGGVSLLLNNVLNNMASDVTSPLCEDE